MTLPTTTPMAVLHGTILFDILLFQTLIQISTSSISLEHGFLGLFIRKLGCENRMNALWFIMADIFVKTLMTGLMVTCNSSKSTFFCKMPSPLVFRYGRGSQFNFPL